MTGRFRSLHPTLHFTLPSWRRWPSTDHQPGSPAGYYGAAASTLLSGTHHRLHLNGASPDIPSCSAHWPRFAPLYRFATGISPLRCVNSTLERRSEWDSAGWPGRISLNASAVNRQATELTSANDPDWDRLAVRAQLGAADPQHPHACGYFSRGNRAGHGGTADASDHRAGDSLSSQPQNHHIPCATAEPAGLAYCELHLKNTLIMDSF